MPKFSSYKKWINEKFKEDSDPIKDMGIGKEELIQYRKSKLIKYLERIGYYNENPFTQVDSYTHVGINKSIDILLRNEFDIPQSLQDIKDDIRYWKSRMTLDYTSQMNQQIKNTINGYKKIYLFLQRLNAKKDYVKENLSEKFIQDSDPIKDMGIGTEAALYHYLKSIGYSREIVNNTRFSTLRGLEAIFAEFAKQNRIDRIKKMLEINPQFNIHGKNEVAFRWAAANGSIELMKLLIKYGADINAIDKGGTGSAIECAAGVKEYEAIIFLLNKGVNVSDYDLDIIYKNCKTDVYEKVKKYKQKQDKKLNV